MRTLEKEQAIKQRMEGMIDRGRSLGKEQTAMPGEGAADRKW